MITAIDTVFNTGVLLLYTFHYILDNCLMCVIIFVFYCEKAGESNVRQMIFMAFIAGKVLLYILSLFSFSS